MIMFLFKGGSFFKKWVMSSDISYFFEIFDEFFLSGNYSPSCVQKRQNRDKIPILPFITLCHRGTVFHANISHFHFLSRRGTLFFLSPSWMLRARKHGSEISSKSKESASESRLTKISSCHTG